MFCQYKFLKSYKNIIQNFLSSMIFLTIPKDLFSSHQRISKNFQNILALQNNYYFPQLALILLKKYVKIKTRNIINFFDK